MSLSICVMTGEPAGRIAEVLAPVRAVADEVVIAADSRVEAATLAGYAALADRLLRVEYRQAEAHLGWLYAQCSGDWILHLDGDEIVSSALAERLPELIATRSIQQYWIARWWLYGDAEHALDQEPWSSDFNNRLLRNDGTVRFRGVQHAHADPVQPCDYVAEPIYHLELLASSLAERRDKAIRYEAARPLLTAAGGGRFNEAFYLPELRPGVRTRALPAVDVPGVRRALAADGEVPAGDTAAVPSVSLAQLDRHWERRAVPESAYRAQIEPAGPAPTLRPGESGKLLFRVANRGTEAWPWGLDRDPAIRMSYHWWRPDGSAHTSDGVRTSFSRTVLPGEQVLVPLEVLSPAEPGHYVLEPDVVHEHVRWFDQGCRVDVAVAPLRDLPAVGPRLRETPPSRRRLLRRLRVPRVIHRVWLGGGDMPAAHEHFGRTFADAHPRWEMRLWGDGDLPSLGIGDAERYRARSPAELSDVVRYEVLSRFGGVYVDTDVECRRNLEQLLAGVQAFAALELPGRVGTAVLGGVPGHAAFVRAARLARQTVGLGPHSADATGPYLMTLIAEQEPDVTIFGAETFYPYLWDEPERAGRDFPDAYAVHHWSTSWWDAEPAS